jgi:hypothetical protein
VAVKPRPNEVGVVLVEAEAARAEVADVANGRHKHQEAKRLRP